MSLTLSEFAGAATAQDAMPSDDYHARGEISNSMLGDFLDSPELFYGRYVANTIPRKATTAAMQFGTLFHDALLLGIDNAVVEIPDECLSSSGSKAGKGWETFKAHYAGMNKVFLKRDEYAALRNMVDAVMSHKVAARLINHKDAAIEQSIFWKDEATGMRLKSRLDMRRLSMPLILDLKTVGDISFRGLATGVHDFGYARQAVFYKRAAQALTGQQHDFIFIAVEKEPPHRVACVDLHQRALERGWEDFRGGLDRIAECHRTGDWTTPGLDKVLKLDLPEWAYSNQWEHRDDGDGN